MMLPVKACPVCQREYPDQAARCADDGVPLVAVGREVTSRSEELIGQIVEGRWKIERIIGKGGMGIVYACRHVVVGKIAAMKVLRAGAEKTDAVLQRFVREAQTANLLRSRHIVEVSDFGQLQNGAFFVVMELLEGQDLARAMRAGLNRRELVHIFMQVTETLQLAHEKGIVHRDLKPDNVYLVREGDDPLFVKLLDFGIAKVMHGENDGSLTETGVILGTPYYMSPEQARAERVDHRTDIYALGVMMYRAFTGRLPFMADSTMGVLTRHITEAPQPPSEIGDIDTATERMILRCLAKKPEYRFQTMRELGDALRQVPVDLAPPGLVGEPSRGSPNPSGAYGAASSGAFGVATPSGMSASAPYSSASTPAPTPAPMFTGASAAFPGAAMQAPPGYTPQPSMQHGAMQPAAMHMAPEPTTRGLAATAPSAPSAPSGPNNLLLVVGALSTMAIGAVVAVVVLGRPGAGPSGETPKPPLAAASTPTQAAPPPAATAIAATATATPTATPSGSAPSPAPSAEPALVGGDPQTPARGPTASSAPSAGPRTTPAHPGVYTRPVPTATTTTPGPKLPNGVRSPFD